MSIPIKLEKFQGPLDLLLHLIDKNKINIYDIPIVTITEQYLEYIRQFKTKNLEIMSEFLIMAATLLNIKSKMLLPRFEDEEKEEIDPRQDLVEKLLEYKTYKYLSEKLRDNQTFASRVLYKYPCIPKEISEYKEEINVNELVSDLTLARLHDIFTSIVKKQTDKIDPIRSKFGTIESEEIDLSYKLVKIQEFGLKNKHFYFRSLLETQNSRMEIIVTFLGVLELIRLGRIIIKQENLNDDISITYLSEDIIQIEEVGF